jgi:hypothetical protein
MKGRPGGFALFPKNWPQNNCKNMANEYLVEIHKYISERIVSAENKKMTADANNEQDSRRFYEGQLFKNFIMAYTYLLDLYKLIDKRLEDANSSIDELADDPMATKFQEGRVRALSDFKDYLTKNLNPKLPGRIRKAYKTKN